MFSFQSIQLRVHFIILLWLYNIYFQVDVCTAKIYRNPAESQLVFNNIEVENINFLRSRFNKRNVKI